MKKSVLLMLSLLFSTLLTSCTLPHIIKPRTVTMSEIRALDYGTVPRNYEKVIAKHLYGSLIDPKSLMIDSISKPKKFVEIELDERNTQPNDEYYNIKFKTSYLVCIRFNAKNTYGGYVGWEWQGYYFKNNELIQVISREYRCEIDKDIIVHNPHISDEVNLVGYE